MKDDLMTESEAYQKNTKEQYEMLGRFVEAFELMVHEVREASIELAGRDGRNRALLEVAFHHQVLTAKPLFDIFRVTVIEILNDVLQEQKDKAEGIYETDPPLIVDRNGNPFPLTIKDRDTFLGLLGFIQGKYESLVNQRNNLLHGTWFVGFISVDDPDSANFHIRKLRGTKHGLSTVEDLPKNATELKSLSERCEAVRNWMSWLGSCMRDSVKIADTFQCSEGTWWFVTPQGNRSTLL
jgi:hypothetical protein